jgi:hypothetical protein
MVKQHWICPSCKKVITTFVALTGAPECSNTHKLTIMEEKNDRTKQDGES